jgi:hypothetical protein
MDKMDKLFNEKLASYERTAPAGAWTKIENNLDGSSRKLWLKIAAGLSVIAIVSFVLVRTLNNDSKNLADNAGNKERIQAGEKVQAKENHTYDPAPVADSETSVRNNKDKEKMNVADQKTQSHKIKNQPVKSTAQFDREEIAEIKQDTLLNTMTSQDTQTVSENVVAVVETIPTEEPVLETDNAVTLVYSAEEVNSKYLNKDQETEATSDDKKTSTLRKLLEKAYDLKHNQDPFGELRQKKNEILALNFKNEKERSQNR